MSVLPATYGQAKGDRSPILPSSMPNVKHTDPGKTSEAEMMYFADFQTAGYLFGSFMLQHCLEAAHLSFRWPHFSICERIYREVIWHWHACRQTTYARGTVRCMISTCYPPEKTLRPALAGFACGIGMGAMTCVLRNGWWTTPLSSRLASPLRCATIPHAYPFARTVAHPSIERGM